MRDKMSVPIAAWSDRNRMWKRDLYASGCRPMVGEVRRDAKQKSHACTVTLGWSLDRRWTNAWRVGFARNKVEKHASLLVTI